MADWRILDDYAVHLTERDERKRLEKKRINQKKMFDELTQQVEFEKSKFKQLKDEDKKFYAESLKDLDVWKKSEEEKVSCMRARCLVEKKQRDDQLLYDKKTREEEASFERTADALAVARLEKEIELEKLKAEKKKVQQRKHMERVFQENEENQRQKAQQKKDNIERDVAMMKEFARIKDQQEADRAAEKEARILRQKNLMERMANTVLAQQNANDKEGDERAERQREEADQRAVYYRP